jgi:hypothetical protein
MVPMQPNFNRGNNAMYNAPTSYQNAGHFTAIGASQINSMKGNPGARWGKTAAVVPAQVVPMSGEHGEMGYSDPSCPPEDMDTLAREQGNSSCAEGRAAAQAEAAQAHMDLLMDTMGSVQAHVSDFTENIDMKMEHIDAQFQGQKKLLEGILSEQGKIKRMLDKQNTEIKNRGSMIMPAAPPPPPPPPEPEKVVEDTADARAHSKNRRGGIRLKELNQKDNGDLLSALAEAVVGELAEDDDTVEQSEQKPKGRSEGRPVDKTDELWIDGETARTAFLRQMSEFVKSQKFDYIMGAFIVLNTLFLGVQIDIKARALKTVKEPEDPMGIKIIESAFCMVFTFELMVRLYAFHPRFCCSAWNIFDTVVVSSALLEEGTKYAAADGNSFMGKLSALRALKALKLVRALRIIRVVRAFRELRIVLMSIINCMRQLFWTLSLLSILIYMVCILILVELTGAESPYGDSEDGMLRLRYYSDLPRSLQTVFQCTTHGALWEESSRSLESIIPWMGLIWTAYMGFVFFAFQNTVTGMCVDQAMTMTQEDSRNVSLDEHELREALSVNMKQFFIDADPEGRGIIGRKAMEGLAKDHDFLAALKPCEIDVRDVLHLFNQSINGASGVLHISDIDMFIAACFRAKGGAMNVDVMALSYKLKVLMRKSHLE